MLLFPDRNLVNKWSLRQPLAQPVMYDTMMRGSKIRGECFDTIRVSLVLVHDWDCGCRDAARSVFFVAVLPQRNYDFCRS